MNGILTLSGYGLRVYVERGHLMAEWGAGRERESRRCPRVHHHLERVIVHGHSGTVSLDALRWLRDVGVPFIQIDHDGEVIATTLPDTRGNAETVRAQVLAAGSEVGLTISKELVAWKIANQLRVLERIEGAERAQDALGFFSDEIEATETGKELLNVEALAAKEYWAAWHDLPISFRDPNKVPSHWQSFGPRNSPWGGRRSTKAVTPGNAMLNYGYAVLAAEARFAAFRAGLDPSIGLYHATRRWRDSLVFDLMDPLRAEVDAFVLDVLGTHRFASRDFSETRQGVCRIGPSVARQLSDAASRYEPLADRVARRVAKACHAAGQSDVRSVLAVRTGRTANGGRLAGAAKQGDAPARRIREQAAANRAWRPDRPLDGIDYEREVLPGLSEIPLRELAAATGLSLSYCSGIRNGTQVPHRRHWHALVEIGSEGFRGS